jgi:hypothetical protein
MMARPKRTKTATESLLQIAVSLEIAVVFFGALALRGLGMYSAGVVAIGTAVALVILVVLYRLLRYRAGVYFGHLVQAALLASFVWDVVIGLSAVVVVGFWIFGAIRGPQLDRGQETASD